MKIEAHHLGKRFNREWVFKNLDFSSEEGKTYVILGPNGSGKSTLLQVFTGMMPASTGSLRFTHSGQEVDASHVYQSIALCAPYQDLIDEFTFTEMVDFNFKFKKCIVPIDEFKKETGLQSAGNKFIGSFSSGMKQRMKVALALYSACDLLFLDEPCTNMDAQAIQWYRDQLIKTAGSRTVFIASNQPHEYPNQAISLNILAYK